MSRLVPAYLLVLLICNAALADTPPDPVKIVAPIYFYDDTETNNYYFTRLLRLALDKTLDSHGPYQLVQPDTYLVDNRLRAALSQGIVDVAWFNTSPEYEEQLLAVKEPLLGEINQYRLLLIREGEQERFDGIESLDDLRKFIGGVGAQWVDVAVMDANNLPYMTANSYVLLFRMLAAGRFDYFSRGLWQVRLEMDRFTELNLALEENIMLYYPNRSYFFVTKGNVALAERLQKGMEIAKEDGSFAALRDSIPHFRWAQEHLKNNTRKQLDLYFPQAVHNSEAP